MSLFARYEERLTLDSLSSNPNFHLCRHPGCTFGQEVAPDINQQFMTCLQCHQLTCLSCRTIWHAGISCAQNIRNIQGPTAEQQKEEEASEALVAKTSKTCPNATCGARVDKISGCDHMKCSRCGSQYCWECQADQEKIWIEGNSAHEKGCKHWRPVGDREGSQDGSDTSDDEDVDHVDDTDVEDARPLEPRERQRRGATGGWHVGRSGAVWEQERQRPVPRTRLTQEGNEDVVRTLTARIARVAETFSPQSAIPESGRMMREQYQERVRADARARAAEQVNQQGPVPQQGPAPQRTQVNHEQSEEATIPLRDPRARGTEPGRTMREEQQEAARIRTNQLAREIAMIRNQASIPASERTAQDQAQEEALQRMEAFARVHQRRVDNRAMMFHQAPEAISQYQHPRPSDQNTKTQADKEALQAAIERGNQLADAAAHGTQHNAERHARRNDWHRTQADMHEQQRFDQRMREMKSLMDRRALEDMISIAEQRAREDIDPRRAHADVHELERMSTTQQLSELSPREKMAWVEQRAQDIADHHTSATTYHQGHPQPPEGHPPQRQPEPVQQQTLSPAPAHQEPAVALRQPALSFSVTRQPPSRTTLAPPGFRFPHSPIQTPQSTMWALKPTPQHPKRETPIFPPGLDLFSPPRPAHLPPGPLFSNPFASPPAPVLPPPRTAPEANAPSPAPSPSSPSSATPIRSTTPPLPLPSTSSKPPAPPTGTPEPLAPFLRLQQTPDPAHPWVWTLQAGHFIVSEYPPPALVIPLASVGPQLRARAVLSNDWATVRELGATANGPGVARLVVDAWEKGDGGEEEEVHKWRRIGGGFPSRGRGRGYLFSSLSRGRGR
ncbi:MAG: hypothetical protein OHK93_007409 [Ramalina farinacea]|uniref:RING-type domain-containing protein n=1 Tax=Ramalina farinacea TaxID=258253 RepID=A0AA43QPN2_9LECA|nr:hypothetical protein [Ramalina farinacea]